MAQYGVTHRGRNISIVTTTDARSDLVHCVVNIDGVAYSDIRGNPFRAAATAQVAGAGFGRALVDAELDGDTVLYRGYFVRLSANVQRDGSWLGSYQFHRNDNPMPFKRVVCEDFHGNTQVEAEEHALAAARQALDVEIAAARL